MRGIWHRDTVSWIIVAAMLPAAVAASLDLGLATMQRFGVALAVIGFWQGVFLFTRAQPLSPIALVTAIAVAILASGATEMWQIVLAASFGTVIGEQIFGGWGRNVVNAGVVTLAFLYFAFPEVLHSGTSPLVAVAAGLAALLLLVTGVLSWRIAVAAPVGLVLATLALGQDPAAPFLEGSLVLGLVFLIGDPVTSASTRMGRLAYGALAGALVAIFGWADAGIGAPQAVVFAALLASLFAPLLDAAAIAVATRKWRGGHG
ncbi:RnfABCDGE type electron transport complex subunit D [uncultured Devosia sp.]|uniref:RnfABCDGE type electron transport complex subunit D n=1 Tax=uncultured Devosia sp. TaxID=211434 RepID=UPI00261069D6|nr:RnfABCDGE type electron transport complex subunit D [uncultured Devosia sp.]